MSNRTALVLVILCAVTSAKPGVAADQPTEVRVDWGKVLRVSKTTPTLQVVVNPPLRRGSPIHDPVFKALHDLRADYVRYVPWLPYPKLGVAELEPPKDRKTSWDFSLIDPMTADFLHATEGHSVILDFSTIPQWMFKTDKPVPYPSDPDRVTWDYEKGTEFRDPSLKEIGDYYARLVSWYTQGGFIDENGQRHESGHHYKIPYWEVLNEVDAEHNMTPQTYTRVYDAIAGSIHQVAPQMKFVGAGLAFPSKGSEFLEYFLNHKNHKPGIPLDLISYHFYASPAPDESLEAQQFTFFDQAEGFLDVVRYIELIRQRLSPQTRTTVDEIGCISADDSAQGEPGHVTKPIPNSYWNQCGATYAYIYSELASLGIDVAGESQLVGYPTQFPSVSMVDWNTGQPNARYWILKLLLDNFGPGDKMVGTSASTPYVYAQGFLSRDGEHRVLLVNKRNRAFRVSLRGASGAREDYVDQTTGEHPAASANLGSDKLSLPGLAVAVVTLPGAH